MKRVTVFCGSSSGNEKIFIETAFLVGQALAAKSIGVVYGGARIGLMGAVADGALSRSGEVIGVLPRFLRTKEIEHAGLSKLYLVESMHERKAKMNELCDGIIALPGGFGTLEELFEMLTWAQLGLHAKPIGLLNVSGFYDGLAEVLENVAHTVRERFKLLRDVEVMTAQGRLSGGLLSMLPLVVALVIGSIAPDYFDPLIEKQTGHFMIAYAIGSIILGHLMIQRLVKIKV